MLSDRSAKQGRHGTRESGQSLSNDAAKLLKTQDAGYLRTVGERIRREMERLEQEVKMQDGIQEVLGEGQTKRKDEDDEDDFFDFEDEEEDGKPKKVVFAESREEQREIGRDLDEDSDDMDEDEEDSFEQLSKNQKQKKSKKQLEAEMQAFRELRAARKAKKRAAEVRRNKLQALKKQYAEITAAERELEWQRGRMDNAVGGTNKNGVKWKIRERKK